MASKSPLVLDANQEMEEIQSGDILELEGGIFNGAVIFNSYVTPPALAVNTNNWDITDLDAANICIFSSTSNISVTGIISSAQSQIIVFINEGAKNVTFINNSASSDPVNRFLMNGNFLMGGDQAASFAFDVINNRWRVAERV